MRSGQKKTSRKRKRKFTQPKKKMQYFYGVSKSKLTHSKLSLSHENETSATLENSVQAYPQPSMVAIVVEHDEAMKRPRATRSFDCKGSETLSPHVASNGKENSDQLYGQDTSTKNMDVHLQLPMTVEGDGPENCQSNANCVEVGQGNLCRGAKRRKSGSVRRFTPDMTSHSFDYLPNTAPANISSCDRVDKLMLGSSDACCKKKFDSSRSSNVITSLIKPISYSASVTNNVQDVAVTFVALRYANPSAYLITIIRIVALCILSCLKTFMFGVLLSDIGHIIHLGYCHPFSSFLSSQFRDSSILLL